MGERASSGGAWRESPAAAPPGQPPDPRAAPGGQQRDAGGTPPGQAQDAGQNGQPDGPGDVTGDETAIPDLLDRIAELEDLRLPGPGRSGQPAQALRRQVSRAEAETRAAVAREWLPVVDNLERALAALHGRSGRHHRGIRAVREQALSVLARLGFPRRDDLGATVRPGPA